MKEFKIGQTFKKEYPPEAAVWCNANGAHIEMVAGEYTIMGNEPVPEPTTAEKVQALERETGLTRAVRELVLSDNSGVSEYVKGKAREIEAIAAELRAVVTDTPEEAKEVAEEPPVTEDTPSSSVEGEADDTTAEETKNIL